MWSLAVAAALAASPILVLDPAGAALDDEARAALGARTVAALAARGVAEVVGQAELKTLIAAEERRQAMGCDEASCAAEIAQALGAERAVASRVTRVGERLVWQLIALDATAGVVLARHEVDAADAAGLFQGAAAAVAPLAGALGGREPPPAFLWPVAFLGAAVAVAAAGLGYDLLSGSSQNGRLDAGDAVGPVAYVAAAGLGVAAFFNPWSE